MKQHFLLILLGLSGLLACHVTEKISVLGKNARYTVMSDRVVQGDNVATVLSPTQIRSNYKSPASATFSRLIKFKFSINEKDNELPPGQDHWVVIGDERQSP
ncbi:MAG TPA: hypothetical protein PK971_12055, partial [Saprospiraceae bacterium]|nr:hypothetical protein [Saprospiraceae bacterium]